MAFYSVAPSTKPLAISPISTSELTAARVALAESTTVPTASPSMVDSARGDGTTTRRVLVQQPAEAAADETLSPDVVAGGSAMDPDAWSGERQARTVAREEAATDGSLRDISEGRGDTFLSPDATGGAPVPDTSLTPFLFEEGLSWCWRCLVALVVGGVVGGWTAKKLRGRR